MPDDKDPSFLERMVDRVKDVFNGDDDEIDGCIFLADLPDDRHVDDEDILMVVLTAGIEDRTDQDAIDNRLAEYRELFNV
jgi:hypothetical protein